MKKTGRRIVGILLSICMVLTMTPMAFAAGEDETGDSGGQTATSLPEAQNGVITLNEDVDISASGLKVQADEVMTLDLNGHKLKVANTSTGQIAVYGSLTIRDSSDNSKNGSGSGKIYTETDYAGAGTGYGMVAAVGENALVTLESGCIYAVRLDASNKGQFGVGVEGGGDFTMTGGKIEAGWYAVSGNGNNKTQDSVINILGGELISTADYALYLPQSGTTNITGGTIYGEAGGVCIQRGTLNVSGDSTLITSKGTGNTGDWGDGTGGQAAAAVNIAAEYGDTMVNISGGKLTAEKNALIIKANSTHKIAFSITAGMFSSDVSEYLTADYACNPEVGETPTTYTVEKKPIVEVSETTTTTDNTTQTIVGGASVEAKSDESGKRYFGVNAKATNDGDDVKAAEVIVGTDAMGQFAEKTDYVELRSDLGTVTVDSAAWKAMNNKANGSDVTITVADNTPDGSTIKVVELTAEDADGQEVYASRNAKGTVSVAYKYSTKAVTEVPTVYYVTDDGALTKMAAKLDNRLEDESHRCVYVVWDTTHFSTYKIVPANAEGTEVSYTDKNGKQQFGTLADAVENAKEGTTVYLNQDVELDATDTSAKNGAININKNLTIDGQGQYKVVAKTGFTGNNTDWGQATPIGNYHVFNITGGNVTLKNLTVDGGWTVDTAYAENQQFGARSGINIWGGNVTLENVTVKGSSTYAVTAGNNATVTITDLTTEGNRYGVNVDQGAKVTIGGENTNIGEAASIVYENNNTEKDGSLTVNDGAYQNVVMQTGGTETLGGTVSLTGGSYTGIVDKTKKDDNKEIGNVVTITGGTYEKTMGEEVDGVSYVAITTENDILDEGCELDENGEVKPAKGSVAAIGGKGYTSLGNALNDAKSGQTVTLLAAEVELNTAIKEGVILEVPSGKTLTVEKTEYTVLFGSKGAIRVQAGGAISVDDTKMIGGSDANIQLTGGYIDLQVEDSALKLSFVEAKAEVPDGKRWTLLLGEAPAQINMKVTLDKSTTLTVTSAGDGQENDGFRVAMNSTLTNEGTVIVKGVMTISSTGIVNGGGKIQVSGVLLNVNSSATENTITLTSGGKVYSNAALTLSDTRELTDKTYGDVTYTNAWEYYAPSHGGSSSSVTKYAVSTEAGDNGSVSVSSKTAARNATVTITVTPDEGYVLDKLTVTDKNGKAISVKDKGDGKYTFTMPSSAVSVKATFKADDGSQTQPTGLPFNDVASADWFCDAVGYVYENEMMSGTSATTFEPAAKLTRAMLAQVVYNLEGSPEAGSGSFTDVAADQWYADAVNWAASQGIVSGYGEGLYGPDDDITREQFASILYRYAQYKGYDTAQGGMAIREFTDYESISDYAVEAMTWAVNGDIINGMGDGTLNPQGDATRAQVAQMLMSFSENVVK